MGTERNNRKLRVLHLEDNEHDHLLVTEVLAADGLDCQFEVARSKAEFFEALGRAKYDLIISDYTLPSYDGLSALSAAQEHTPDTPFIFFSGTIGEEVAVESLKNGAVDYVLKQRPGRLSAAVRRALRNAEERARLREAELALEKSQERLRIIAKATNDVIWEWNLQNDEVWFGENFCAAFGHNIDPGLDSERWFELIHPDEKVRVVSSLCILIAGGGRVWWNEYRLRRGDGSYSHVFDRASVIYDEARKPLRLVGIKIDVSERKEAEEKIREQTALLNKARDAIIVCDIDRRIAFWNKGAERIYGWTAADAVGQDVNNLLFGGKLPPQVQEIAKNLDEHDEWMGELHHCARDGKPVVVQTRTTIVRDDNGKPKSLLTINTDITEQKQLEEQFLRAQRLESLGVLVSGIAHDLNNTLVPILIGVEILRDEPLSEDAVGMVHTMEASARRSAEMIRQMLAFARGGEASRLHVQPARLLKEMGKVVDDTFPKSIHCEVHTGKNLRQIFCVPTQMHQVLMNLCVNARDAMPQGGTLTLTAENTLLNESTAAPLGAKPGRYVCISVKDTGTGMKPEQMVKLFQPFFTTKAPGKGTGLGLSTCLSIVKKHDGVIAVESKLNLGTEFKVYIPAADASLEEPAATPAAVPPSGHGEHVLVIDDEEAILAMTRAVLENFGYHVSTAADGIDALAIFRKNPDSIQLVIADHFLPLMGGDAIVTAIREIRPSVKVLFTSGSEKDVQETTKTVRAEGFIAKPFASEELLRLVHEILSRK